MGDVGGCKDIMMIFFAAIVGGYVNFTSDVETMLHLYSKNALYRSDSINTLPKGTEEDEAPNEEDEDCT